MHDNSHANCRHLLGSLSDYIDGSLADELCAEIKRHLESCENCHVVVDTLQKTVSLYHHVEEPVVPVDVRERLYHRLNLDEFLEK